MTATSVIPGIRRTSRRFATERTVPLIVGGGHTIVGFTPARDVHVHHDPLASGDDVERVDPALRLADDLANPPD
jgi:hypothetical protein